MNASVDEERGSCRDGEAARGKRKYRRAPRGEGEDWNLRALFIDFLITASLQRKEKISFGETPFSAPIKFIAGLLVLIISPPRAL